MPSVTDGSLVTVDGLDNLSAAYDFGELNEVTVSDDLISDGSRNLTELNTNHIGQLAGCVVMRGDGRNELLLVLINNVGEEGYSTVVAVLDKHLVDTGKSLSLKNETLKEKSCSISVGALTHEAKLQSVNLAAVLCVDVIKLLLIFLTVTVGLVNNGLKIEDLCIVLVIEALKLKLKSLDLLIVLVLSALKSALGEQK